MTHARFRQIVAEEYDSIDRIATVLAEVVLQQSPELASAYCGSATQLAQALLYTASREEEELAAWDDGRGEDVPPGRC